MTRQHFLQALLNSTLLVLVLLRLYTAFDMIKPQHIWRQNIKLSGISTLMSLLLNPH